MGEDVNGQNEYDGGEIEFQQYSTGNGSSGYSADTGGNFDGTVKRRRGRPRKNETEEVQHILGDEPKTRQTRSSNKSINDITRATVDITLMAGFQGVGQICSLLTDNEPRPWWQMTAEQVSPISTPLCRYIETLPANVQKNIQKYSMPAALLIGVVSVVSEPINYEMMYARQKRELLNGQRPNRQYNARQTNSATNTANSSNSNSDASQTINSASEVDQFRPNRTYHITNGNELENI